MRYENCFVKILFKILLFIGAKLHSLLNIISSSYLEFCEFQEDDRSIQPIPPVQQRITEICIRPNRTIGVLPCDIKNLREHSVFAP